jgi:quercetin dioxygenase-like cupin family protein
MNVMSSENMKRESVGAGKNVFRQILIGPDTGPNFAMRRFIIEPGGYMPMHTNTVEHEQYVLRGQAAVKIGNEVYNVKEGDVVFIPAGVPHNYKTTGDTPFEFLCMVPNNEDVIELVE